MPLKLGFITFIGFLGGVNRIRLRDFGSSEKSHQRKSDGRREEREKTLTFRFEYVFCIGNRVEWDVCVCPMTGSEKFAFKKHYSVCFADETCPQLMVSPFHIRIEPHTVCGAHAQLNWKLNSQIQSSNLDGDFDILDS